MTKFSTILLLCMLVPVIGAAAPPEKTNDVNVVNEPTVHVGSNVDVNVVNVPAVDAAVVNQPTVHIGSSVDVNAYQAGDWNISVGETPRDFKELTGNFSSGDGWIQAYQVPAGRRLVITDIYFIQRIYGGWLNTISFNRNPDGNLCGVGSNTVMHVQLLGLEAGERNQVHYPLRTGYEFTAGERVCLAQSGGGLIFYNLSGYETAD